MPAGQQEGEQYSPLKAGRSIVKWDGTMKGQLVVALTQCTDSGRLRSCLWPEVLQETLVLRTLDIQLDIDLRDLCAVVP